MPAVSSLDLINRPNQSAAKTRKPSCR